MVRGCCAGSVGGYDEDDQPEPIFKKIRDRGCTDIGCCVFLVFYIALMAAIAGFSVLNGNINYIIYPHDYLGQVRAGRFCAGHSSCVEQLCG